MSFEEPQNTSIILDEVLSEGTAKQDHDTTSNQTCDSDEEDNIVLFDTTNSSNSKPDTTNPANNKPDILKT